MSIKSITTKGSRENLIFVKNYGDLPCKEDEDQQCR